MVFKIKKKIHNFKKSKILLFLVIFLITPNIIFALDTEKNFRQITGDIINSLYSPIINLIFMGAFVFFFYGVMMFIFKSGEDKEKGKGLMIWGIVALFIMFSIFGIINILKSTFNL